MFLRLFLIFERWGPSSFSSETDRKLTQYYFSNMWFTLHDKWFRFSGSSLAFSQFVDCSFNSSFTHCPRSCQPIFSRLMLMKTLPAHHLHIAIVLLWSGYRYTGKVNHESSSNRDHVPWSLYYCLGSSLLYTFQISSIFVCGDYHARSASSASSLTFVTPLRLPQVTIFVTFLS